MTKSRQDMTWFAENVEIIFYFINDLTYWKSLKSKHLIYPELWNSYDFIYRLLKIEEKKLFYFKDSVSISDINIRKRKKREYFIL